MNKIMDTIKQRYSVRNYVDKPIKKEIIKKINDFFETNRIGPMGNEMRFDIFDATGYARSELKSLGTYGLISGDRTYVVGAITKSENSMEDFGYCMEKSILMLTQLGLGTCWLGGTFNRSIFAQKINLSDNEVLPCITPIGYIGEKKTFKENLIRTLVGAKKRKKHEELFFDLLPDIPLNLAKIGKYADVLEAVRLGPSASNKQPWRIIRDASGTYHFYLDENGKYNNGMGEIKLQNVDMGIAMCHFELAAIELGIKGSWIKSQPSLDAGRLKYIVSWQEN